MVYHRMQQERQRLQAEIQKLQEKIDGLPAGKLVCAKNGAKYRWYNSDGKNKIYIPRKHRKLAEQLAVKKYYSLQKAQCVQEAKAVDFYLRHHGDFPKKAQDELWDHPEYRELLKSHFLPRDEQLMAWTKAPYEKNPYYPEGLIHKTVSGDLVRSKSEAMIIFFLYTYQIPFRYECALQLGELTIYPDFTIRHPNTGQWYYWEHFGRMDDAAYAKNASAKLQQYIAHGIIPTMQLITTYETMENPLCMETVEMLIRKTFL